MKKDYNIVISILFITSLLGWVIETFSIMIIKEYVPSRGATNLPFCLIYGVAITTIYLIIGYPSDKLKTKISRKFENNKVTSILTFISYFLIVFFLSFFIEFLTGFVIDKLNISKLWDYKNVPLNIMGYVAIPVLILFGIGGTIYMYFIYPRLYRFLSYIETRKLIFLNFVLYIMLFWAYIQKI